MNAILDHVRKSVVDHQFTDTSDWAQGLDELAGLDDKTIDGLHGRAVDPYDADLLTVDRFADYVLARLRGARWEDALREASGSK